MRIKPGTIYFQLLISFILIIIFALSLSTVFEYRTYSSQLPGLMTEILSRNIAHTLSSSYTRNGSWIELENEIRDIAALEDTALRIIVKDGSGKTLYNSFSEILQVETVELIEGESYPVLNLESSEAVGLVTIYISSSYVAAHVQGYISSLLKSILIKALIAAAAALLLSIILSRYISAPVVKLTLAAKTIARDGSSNPIDISSTIEINELCSAFNSMLESLETQRESRKQLLADVSHEINTPLNAMRLEARGLTDGLVSSEEAGRYIIDEIDALRNVIYDLDWIAETDSGAFKLNKEKCSVANLLKEEIRRWQHKAAEKERLLEMMPGIDAQIEIEADLIKMSTVLGNLIDNALKYAPRGSAVSLNCRHIQNAADEAEITVCDNGPAVAPEHRDRIFERFYRTDSAMASATRGRGLGLAIVKQIVELHGGIIRLECGGQSGNCFIITLPACSIFSPQTGFEESAP